MGWSNYWGCLVYPPFAVLVGLLMLYVAMFGWERLIRPSKRDKKGKTHGLFKGNWRKRQL